MNTKINAYKIDLLLKVNSVMTSCLGVESTEEEKAFVEKQRRDNLKKIKEIDPSFFDRIVEDE